MSETSAVPAVHGNDDNSEFIKQSIPDWLAQSSAQRISAFSSVDLERSLWMDSLSPLQRRTLKSVNEACLKSQQAVDKELENVQTLKAFAAPLLNKALKDTFNISLDIEGTYLRLYKPLKLGTFGVKVNTFKVMEVSLLQAALHNFEASECEAGAFDVSSGFTQYPDKTGTSPGITPTLGVPAFITLCRTLDIGARYQAHLKETLLPADEAIATQRRNKVITSQKDALRAAAYLALLKQDIRPADFILMQQVIDGERNPTLAGKPVWFSCLSLANRVLKGCVVFTPVEKYRYAEDFIVYIPHDPVHPLKRYDSFADLKSALTRQLLAQDKQPVEADTEGRPAPTRYQRFISQFFDEADKAPFFNRFTEPAPGPLLTGEAVARSPITQTLLQIAFPTLTQLAVPQEFPPPQPGPRVRAESPNLYPMVVSRRGLWAANVDLWNDLYEQGRDKHLSDARTQAVPTADVDARVRAQKIAHLLEGGAAVLGLVSMFVPVLGELMMATMAEQLLYETFEGVMEWSEGDREAAKQHVLDVAQNLAVMAVLAGAGKGLQKLTLPPAPALIQSLKPVKLPSGEQRLWKPDLAPYRSEVTLPEDAVVDDLGLHRHEQHPLLPLDDQLYQLKPEPGSDTYRVQHPTRPDAYAPEVAHNGAGAWRHEGEEPSTWDGPMLMRRLGYRTQGLSDAQLEQVRVASGTSKDQLRQLHVEHQPPPALLTDSLERFRINQQIDTFIQQMSSDDPLVYTQADPLLQEQIVDHSGLSHEPAPGSTRQELAEQLARWRRDMAREASKIRRSLFDTRYRAYDATRDPHVQRLKDEFSDLPSSVASRLLETTTEAAQPGISPRLRALAREYQQEVRLERAYEGLFLDVLESQDSRRLALHTLETLPGWPQDLRLEVRLGSERGSLVDAIGAQSAPYKRVLAMDPDNLFGQTDLYGAVLAALNHVQRRALGNTARDAGTLRARVRQAPLNRDALRPVLLEYPVFRQPLTGNPRLLGGMPLLSLNQLRSPAGRVRKLYPGFTEEQVNGFIETQGADVRNELTRREEQYATLKRELKAWVTQSAREERSRDSASYSPGSREQAVAGRLKDCWRRQSIDSAGEMTGRQLKINAQVKLPSLSADFSHVDELILDQVSLTDTPEQFLSHFPNLKRLTLQFLGGLEQHTLTELPAAITAMKELTYLDLSDNAIRLTESTATRLAGLTRLEVLNLKSNPLGQLPDFSGMTRLRTLNLRLTGIDQWPPGLLDLPALEVVDLSANRLTAVPESQLNPPAAQVEASIRLNRVTLLHHNPFTLEANEQMRAYLLRMARTRPGWRNTGLPEAFRVPMSNDPQVARLRNLFPGFNQADAERFVLQAGTDAQAALTRLETEWQTLSTRLETWVEEHFMVDAGNDRIHRGRAVERRQFAERLKQCWQRSTPIARSNDGRPIGHELDLSGLNIGELPTLEADFSHVGVLTVRDMPLNAGLDRFLEHFTFTRWLDLSQSRLSAIPPSLARLTRLTRLNLQRLQLTMTEADLAVLESITTLKSLDLSSTPLPRAPNLGALTQLRGVMLRNTGITQWPDGLGVQPVLDLIDLRDNRISTLPQAQINPTPDQAVAAIRANNVTFIEGNPLTEDAQVELMNYRLNTLAQYPETATGRLQGSMRYQAPRPRPAEEEPIEASDESEVETQSGHWMEGLAPEQVTRRKAMWETIATQPGAEVFLGILNNLRESAEYRSAYADLQARVWAMIEAAGAHDLREELFAIAGDPRCGDRAALVFSDMEIKVMTWKATRMAGDGDVGTPLLHLARGLFRLDEVEKVASRNIGSREAQIRLSNRTPEQKLADIAKLEDIEIRLAYRMGLSERLELPGQPSDARYTASGRVSQAMLDSTATQIERLDNTELYLHSLLGREFWQTFIRNRYAEQFEALREPFQLREQGLSEQHEAGVLTDADYETQAQDVQLQLSIEEARLVESLTLKDWIGALKPCKEGCLIV
ncbi:NEL-type E3 ubiquitin ligase domain-containing protein [Pseudomonas sp. MWU16-30323]|uniref:NEL-type E3 ubiquitin ligase domain-containing protein n=1 Tax=Pseudomonas sp. MWU16-30323 TaxID=2878094 RepID=UPI001CFA9C33|nr:NEL-type E3 ubiquitin ligase domain-containing protein [Pseudomonas sp. MWU16-30323]